MDFFIYHPVNDPMNPLNSRMKPILAQYHQIKEDHKDKPKEDSSSSSEDEKEKEEEKKEKHVYDNIADPRKLAWVNDERLGHGEYKQLGDVIIGLYNIF